MVHMYLVNGVLLPRVQGLVAAQRSRLLDGVARDLFTRQIVIYTTPSASPSPLSSPPRREKVGEGLVTGRGPG